MTALVKHEIAWVAAAPIWKSAVKDPQVLRRPTIVGFGQDDFMEALLQTLANAPEKLADRVASGPSRSFRERLPGEAFGATPKVSSGTLKLYQPVHGWFYLVTGSLVCRLPGLPDHPVDLALGESAGFVVRRLQGSAELGLVADASGRKSWQTAPTDKTLTREEVLPMFPLGFTEGARRRKLLAGLIPAGSQEALFSAPIGSAPDEGSAPPPVADAFEGLQARVIRPIESLQDPAAQQPDDATQKELSRFALLDLADFLTFYLPDVLEALQGTATVAGKAAALVSLLQANAVDGKTFADLLAAILSQPLTSAFDHNFKNAPAGFAQSLSSALQDAVDEAKPGARQVQVVSTSVKDVQFVARLVYRRPQCAPLSHDVLSAASEAFVIAHYFDPEAPARPIRISLPFDTSIGGLRQFRKNVKMVLSQSLRQKAATSKINDNVPGPSVDCGGLELSIPIITIVAMIVLFVFIVLLNLVFWWIPFVKICLPKISVEP
ncbi:MAG TPA: hypothetical protein VGH20_21365 [Myxococcales bacterium]